MKNLGKYQGAFCFECSEKEYQKIFNRGDDNGKHIYIVNGTMIRKNKIIGYYDGNYVEDVNDGQSYFKTDIKDSHDIMSFTADNSKWDEKFVEEVKTTRQEGHMTVASYEELVKQDIDFRKYSTVVDEFFALLEV